MSDVDLRPVLDMAREAGALAQKMRSDPDGPGAEEKGPMDIVTAADHAVETLLRARIRKIDPNAGILGEEGGLQGDGRDTWIVDPIDGTVNFYRGMPDWAVSIARFDGARLTLGVIHAPDLGLTAWAERGRGSYLNGKRIAFGGVPTRSPLVALGTSSRSSLSAYLHRIETLRDADVEHRRHGAATICFLGVLAGWFDGFHEPQLNIWDAAAGLLIVAEAGGAIDHDRFDTFLAGPSDVLALNRAHPELAALLA